MMTLTMEEIFNADSSLRSNSEIWFCSIISACLVGLSGILPLVLIPVETGRALKQGAPAARLRLLLSFAVGSLLGDVFLHLLPEAYVELKGNGSGTNLGLCILLGILTFFIIEKIFAETDDETNKEETSTCTADHSTNGVLPNSHPASHGSQSQSSARRRRLDSGSQNGDGCHDDGCHGDNAHHQLASSEESSTASHIQTRGWLNLLANVIDNFTHGLAVGVSFVVSRKVGCLTTFAILVHEIPHEMGDFAILLQSGFSRWDAAAAQLLTASGGMIGAITALSIGSLGDLTSWILAFTSGGFIYIAMVSVMPDLLNERNHRESFKQVVGVCSGILVMALVNGVAG